MSSVIRESRERAGHTIYDLAERLGVTVGAVSQMERSEAAGTIKLATQWLDDWREVALRSVEETVRLLLDTPEYVIEMRQNGPFAGVLSQEERREAIERAARATSGGNPVR